MVDLMHVIRRALGRESTPIEVPPIPPVALTPGSRFSAHERRIGILEARVKVQTARLTEHIESEHGAN